MKEFASKINILGIVHEHFETLKDNSTGKRSARDIFVIYIFPLILGGVLAFFVPFPKELAGGVINFFSIFSALLFNFLVLVLDAIRKEKEKPEGMNTRSLALLEQTYRNVAYAIVASLFGVIVMLMPLLTKLEDRPPLHAVVGGLAYFVFLHFLCIMGMILKRMNAVVQNVINPQSGGGN